MGAAFTQLTAVIVLMLVMSQTQALSISHVSHKPSYIEVNTRIKIAIRFALDEAATVVLRIYDDREFLIKEERIAGFNKSDNTIIWDGRDNNGKRVPPEAYHYTLEASNGSDSVVYDPSDITGNDVVEVSNLKWDKKADSISYSVRKNTRVSLRIGIDDGGPLLATILDWQPRARGVHKEKWDGIDSSGTVDIKRLVSAEIFGQAYSLSGNTIIFGPYQSDSEYVENIDTSHKRKRTYNSKKMFNYHGKDAASRSDFAIDVALPKDIKLNKDKLPIFKGSVPIRINIPKQELKRMQTNRFEPMLFVDGTYISELESGFFPLTWRMHAKDYKEGEHYITINIRGYDGQVGSASRRIVVKH